jgi:hypothetical protein
MVDKTRKIVLISLTVIGLITVSLIENASAQQNHQPKAEIINSKYLSIKDQKFRNETSTI